MEKYRSFHIANKIRKVRWACSGTRSGAAGGDEKTFLVGKTLEAAGGHQKNSGQQVGPNRFWHLHTCVYRKSGLKDALLSSLQNFKL